MKSFTRNFAQGLLVLAPLFITGWIVWKVVKLLDGWVGAPIPGLGIILAVAGITLIGFLTRNVLGGRLLSMMESVMTRVPFVKLLYGSLRDLFGAFVGDRRSFDRPVFVEVSPMGAKVFGFATCESFDDSQLNGHVSVYLPQSYNFAGNMIVVPRERVHRLDADGAEFMAFVMSGGVTEMNAAKTIIDPVKKAR